MVTKEAPKFRLSYFSPTCLCILMALKIWIWLGSKKRLQYSFSVLFMWDVLPCIGYILADIQRCPKIKKDNVNMILCLYIFKAISLIQLCLHAVLYNIHSITGLLFSSAPLCGMSIINNVTLDKINNILLLYVRILVRAVVEPIGEADLEGSPNFGRFGPKWV